MIGEGWIGLAIFARAPLAFQNSSVGIFGSLTAKTIGEKPWADWLGQVLTPLVKAFLTKKKSRTSDIFKAKADATTAQGVRRQ